MLLYLPFAYLLLPAEDRDPLIARIRPLLRLPGRGA